MQTKNCSSLKKFFVSFSLFAGITLSPCFSYEWFSFSNSGFDKIKKISDARRVPVKPWTEAVRISSFGVSDAESSGQAAYMLINRCGVLSVRHDEMALVSDKNLFENRTADNLVFMNDIPVFAFSRNTFFNKNTGSVNHPFLVQFDPNTGISYPLINTENLVDKPGCEVADFSWDGRTFTCCIKSETQGKTDFDYLKWTSKIPLLSLSPVTASDNISTSACSADSFRELKRQIPYKLAPDRILELLKGGADKTSFVLSLQTAGGSSPRVYINENENNQVQLNAWGIISKSWSAVLFQDGTLYLEGALDGRRIIRGGKPVAMRLPRLPESFVYSGFVISGTTLYAAWEESNFYETGRSGVLKVNLDDTLYKAIK